MPEHIVHYWGDTQRNQLSSDHRWGRLVGRSLSRKNKGLIIVEHGGTLSESWRVLVHPDNIINREETLEVLEAQANT